MILGKVLLNILKKFGSIIDNNLHTQYVNSRIHKFSISMYRPPSVCAERMLPIRRTRAVT
jgi:hypothetical protein